MNLKNGIKNLINESAATSQKKIKGTSPEYTDKVNKLYEKGLPLLREKGYDVDGFTQENVESYLHDLFKSSDADEELQGLYKKGDYTNGNKIWDERYKPTFDALMAAYDKLYNDYWIKNAPMGYED